MHDVAKYLAEAHRKADKRTCGVWLVPDDNEVRLVEVSQSTHYTGELLPVRFPAKGEVTYPTVIVLLHPKEFEQVESGELELPFGWAPRKAWEEI